jgi:hypothetical protein
MVWGWGQAQIQIPNGGFENWTTPPGAQYQEPTGGWWTSLNALRSLTAPITVEKSTDAHSGTYSAKLTTALWGTVLLPGLLVSGEFDIQNPSFLVQGQPFGDLPSAFQGWYKYVPVNGDSAGIAALLTRWNAGAGRRDTVAAAAVVVTSTQATWTGFDLPFFYFQSGIPDSILVALVSSGDGQNFNGQAGSTLWIDDLNLDYTTAAPEGLGPQASPQVGVHGRTVTVQVPIDMGASQWRLLDIQGRELSRSVLHPGSQSVEIDLPSGVYLVEIVKAGKPVFRQKIAYFQP